MSFSCSFHDRNFHAFYFKVRKNHIVGCRLIFSSATLLLEWHELSETLYRNILCRSFQNTFTLVGPFQLTISYNSLINTRQEVNNHQVIIHQVN